MQLDSHISLAPTFHKRFTLFDNMQIFKTICTQHVDDYKWENFSFIMKMFTCC